MEPTYFNPRSREGSDADSTGKRQEDGKISIHAPVKGATRLPAYPLGIVTISIHAPVKGATLVGQLGYQQLDISIHAPVKGATVTVAVA